MFGPVRRAAVWLTVSLAFTSPAFAVNLLTNPSFDGDLRGWKLEKTTYDARTDATDLPGSGSAKSTFEAGRTIVSISQCVAAGPGPYTLGGKILSPKGTLGPGMPSIAPNILVSFFSLPGCTFGYLGHENIYVGVDPWFQTVSRTVKAPEGTVSVWVTGQVSTVHGIGTYTVHFDDLVFDDVVPTDADLAVTTTGPSTVKPGDTITYDISMKNNGPAAAEDVVLTDVLPPGVTFVSYWQNYGLRFSCTTGATVRCTIPILSAGAAATFTITAKVSSPAVLPPILANSATVSSSLPDPAPGNNTSTVSTTVVSTQVPALSPLALLILATLIAFIGATTLRS